MPGFSILKSKARYLSLFLFRHCGGGGIGISRKFLQVQAVFARAVTYMETENEMTNNSSMQCHKCGGVSLPKESTNLFFRQGGVWVFPEL